MLTYKRGDTIALAGTATPTGQAQSMAGWSVVAVLKPVGGQVVEMTCAWAQVEVGVLRISLESEQTRTLAAGPYEIEVSLQRNDGFVLTTQTAQVRITERMTPLLTP